MIAKWFSPICDASGFHVTVPVDESTLAPRGSVVPMYEILGASFVIGLLARIFTLTELTALVVMLSETSSNTGAKFSSNDVGITNV